MEAVVVVVVAGLQVQTSDTTDLGTIATVIGGLLGVGILGYLGFSVSGGGVPSPLPAACTGYTVAFRVSPPPVSPCRCCLKCMRQALVCRDHVAVIAMRCWPAYLRSCILICSLLPQPLLAVQL